MSSAGRFEQEVIFIDRISFSHRATLFAVVFKTVITKGKDYKDVIKLWAGPKLMVFLADPRDIELILSSQVYLDKSPEYRFFKPWLGNGLLISSGERLIKVCISVLVPSTAAALNFHSIFRYLTRFWKEFSIKKLLNRSRITSTKRI